MTREDADPALVRRPIRTPVMWGLVFGAIQAASPLVRRWLEPATVHALSLSLMAAVYIGFAVADGRPRVIAVECTIAGVFLLLAATAVTATAWILVIGYAGHGLKGLLAGTPPVRRQHPLVAAVLRRRRLARRRNPHPPDSRRNRLSLTAESRTWATRHLLHPAPP
jgi:hypothetical protein